MHDPVRSLSDEEHLMIWRENIFNSIALCVARTESFENGSQQLEFATGKTDDAFVTANLDPVGIVGCQIKSP